MSRWGFSSFDELLYLLHLYTSSLV